MSTVEPEGELVTGPLALHPKSNPPTLVGQYVTLRPMSPSDAPALFQAICGSQNDHLYKYMVAGPFPDLESFSKQVDNLCNGTLFYPFVVLLHPTLHSISSSTTAKSNTGEGKAVGIITYLNIVLHHRRLEIGYVLFSSLLQRTTAATESIYLLIKHAFDDLHYLRVEWKANNLNEASKRAALRLGFKFEGVFRKHMILHGRRRDSVWYSLMDDEWFSKGKGGIKEALVKWLDPSNFDGEGKQRRKLESFRED
jgi:RimJ/RimL family protein N-acetyltransferase